MAPWRSARTIAGRSRRASAPTSSCSPPIPAKISPTSGGSSYGCPPAPGSNSGCCFRREERLLDGRLKLVLRQETFEALHLLALAVENQRHRQRLELQLCRQCLGTKRYRVVHRMLLQKRLDAFRTLLIHGDAHYNDALGSELLVHLVETGNLLDAGHAPSRPEVHDDHFAGQP